MAQGNGLVERIAERTAELVVAALCARSRDEISLQDLCREYGISRQTVRRRVAAGLLTAPVRKRGRLYFARSTVEKAEINGQL